MVVVVALPPASSGSPQAPPTDAPTDPPPAPPTDPVRRREPSLATQFLLLQLVVVALLLVVVTVLSLRQSTASFEEQQGAQMRSVAEDVAALDLVRAELTAAADEGERRDADAAARALAPAAVQGVNLSGATTVSILAVGATGEADDLLRSTVLASSEPSLVGTHPDLGESDVLAGRQWSGDVETDDGRAVAGHAPVYSDDGRVVGAVLAEQTYPTAADRLTGAAPDLVVFLGVGALLGGVGSVVVARLLKRRSRGLGAGEIARLADHREALLHAIREGVIAVGTDGRVTMANDAARVTLGLEEDPRGRRVADLGLGAGVVDLLTGVTAAEDAVAIVAGRVVVFNRREASAGGRGIGSVTTLRDRTELIDLQGRLDANVSITDTLRAQTHEFDNLLHTISGLAQLGDYDELSGLLGVLTRTRAEVGDLVADRIADPATAALIVAKHAVAAERSVRLELDPGTRLPRVAPGLVADLTAVVGNLVDNAIDASAGTPDALVEVWLLLDRGAVHVRVRDNGPGVADELADEVFERGFSTKPVPAEQPGGRGVGLALVRLVCRRCGGEVSLTRAGAEGGAVFSAVLPVAEDDRDRHPGGEGDRR